MVRSDDFDARFERTERALTQNQLQELLESDQIRAMVEGAEERGYIDPAAIEAFAVEQDLNEQEVEELTRELERTGLEIGPPVVAAPAVTAEAVDGAGEKDEKEKEDEVEVVQPAVAVSGSADSLQLFLADVGNVVDPPVGAARRRESRAHDSCSRPRRRASAEALARGAPARSRARP